jgi:hypothetical protein
MEEGMIQAQAMAVRMACARMTTLHLALSGQAAANEAVT